MELSAELFSQIAASVGIDPSRRVKHEKRRADRLALRLQVRITPSADPLSIAASYPRSLLSVIRDLSPRGASLQHPTPMPHGAQFLLHLISETGQPAIHLLCSVVHCNRSPQEEGYIIGAEFTCVQDGAGVTDSNADAKQLDRIRHSILD
jgi:PilZ domain